MVRWPPAGAVPSDWSKVRRQVLGHANVSPRSHSLTSCMTQCMTNLDFNVILFIIYYDFVASLATEVYRVFPKEIWLCGPSRERDLLHV